MKIKFILLSVAVIFIAGCSGKSAENKAAVPPTENETESGERPAGYINTMLNAKDRAETNVQKLQDAQKKELEEGLGE